MKEEVRKLRKTCDSIKKKIFYERREMIKRYNELQCEIVKLRQAICKYEKIT
jgi:hypothetical protein